MTTINTIEDLIRLLREKPEWAEELRAVLLPPDVLELPALVAQLTESVNDRFAQVNDRFAQVNDRLDQVNDRLDQLTESVNDRFAQANDRFERQMESVNRRFDRIEIDLGILKGHYARESALRASADIALSLGLRRVRDLGVEDLYDLLVAADTSDLARGEMESFRRADLVMEARDADGETVYIAVEVSFTANGRDTNRAIRNAQWLSDFTGKDSRAVVAGVRRDNRLEESIAAGEVIWYQLDASDMEPE